MSTRPGIRPILSPIVLLLLLLASGFIGGCSREPPRPDIILVVLDTVRLDATGLVPSPQPWSALDHSLTPNLDRLAAEGTAFTNAWSTAPWTVPSHASLFTGLLPSRHLCLFRNPKLDPSLPTMAGILGESGYQTAAFYSNPWLADRTTGLLNGFDAKREAPVGGLNTMVTRNGDQGGRLTLRNVKNWLRERDAGKPALVFVNFLEAHLPYDPPLDYRREHLADLSATASISIDWGHEYNAGIFDPGTVDWPAIRRLYGADVWAADRLLGRLRALLEADGIWDDSIVVVVSDHGENLGENGTFEHQFSIRETLLSVPLVIKWPKDSGMATEAMGAAAARSRREDPVMVSDLFATVLAWARIGDRGVPEFSRSLCGDPAGDDRPLISEYSGPSAGLIAMLEKMNPRLDKRRLGQPLRSVRVGDMRLTDAAADGRILHDLGADPGQATDVAAENPEIVRELQGILDRVMRGAPAKQPAEGELDEATRKQLESLGYVH